MLTVFTVAKHFRGQINIIQRNAIESWKRLHSDVQVILLGNEEGSAEIAKEKGLVHILDVETNEFGTPLLNGAFMRAERCAQHRLLCFVNCDILLMSDFIRAVSTVAEQCRAGFLAVGECVNLDVCSSIGFERDDWEESLRLDAVNRGKRRGPYGIDYFVFPKGFYSELPPFALGRAGFDQWLVWKARQTKHPVVDVSPVACVIHQNHDYAHVAGGREWSYRGEEAIRNIELAGSGRSCLYSVTHKLKPAGLRPYWIGKYLSDRVQGNTRIVWWRMLILTQRVRHLLGLRRENLRQLGKRFGVRLG
jgi:hypothetical protein